MWIPGSANRYVIAREENVVHVDFRCSREPPGPQFPGAGALRGSCGSADEEDQSLSDRENDRATCSSVMSLPFVAPAVGAEISCQ
jgi:hypothetical protein